MPGELRYELIDSAALDADRRAQMLALFDATYRQADPSYLAESIARLRVAGLAFDGAALVAFALGEARLIDLPRLPRTVVRLAGITCVAEAQRRRHVMVDLMQRAIDRDHPAPTALVAGRMAHPATFRRMVQMPSAVPRPGRRPTAWQGEVGAAVAAAYGARGFDPETFVCRGRGTPIGYPLIEIDASADEWAAFAAVDRSRGDSLLGIAWTGEVPDQWMKDDEG